MFIIKYYLMGAVVSFGLALFAPSWYFTIILLWIGLSLSLVSFAYLTDAPEIFRKRADGVIPIYIKWMFWPFFVGVQLYNAWARKNDSVPPVQEIAPNLFLACRLFPSDEDFLTSNKVGAILDATAEFNGLNWSAENANLSYLNIPILDHKTPHENDLIRAVNWIKHHIDQDKGVVVHCALGRGRSVLIVAAYLLASNQADSVQSALKKINSVRGTARLNKYQMKKLSVMHNDGVLKKKDTILLIVNPVSGAKSWTQYKESIEQMLAVKYTLDIRFTSECLTARDIVEEHKCRNYKFFVACGGDGTVNEVASALINTEHCMAIIPLGTTNALSQVLFDSASRLSKIERACDIILAGHPTKMDTMQCNEDTVLLLAGLGFEHKMISRADRELKNKSGEFAYIESLGVAIHENENFTLTLVTDDNQAETVTASSLVIANAAPATTILAHGGREPDPFDGKLDLTIVDTKDGVTRPLASLGLRGLTRLVTDTADVKGITYRQIETASIRGEGPLEYVIDGEIRKSTKIDIKINPSSLLVLSA